MDPNVLRAVLLDAKPNIHRPEALHQLKEECRQGARLMFRLQRHSGGQALLNLAHCLGVMEAYEEQRVARLMASAEVPSSPGLHLQVQS